MIVKYWSYVNSSINIIRRESKEKKKEALYDGFSLSVIEVELDVGLNN